MSSAENTSLAQALLATELDYFRAGSTTENLLNGQLCWTSGFESLASATVLHHVDNIADGNSARWQQDVVAEFRRRGGQHCCVYFTGKQAQHSDPVAPAPMKATVEIGLAGQLAMLQQAEPDPGGKLVPINNPQRLEAKRQLYRLNDAGADGHSMQQGLFADFEQVKCAAGYMTSYLYYHHEQLSGAVSLAMLGNFARLKNLYVHPDSRGCGVGRQIVLRLIAEADLKGAVNFGTYAIENSYAARLYTHCGLVKQLQQVEGVMPL